MIYNLMFILTLSQAGPSHEGSTPGLCQAVARSRIHDKLPRRIMIWLQAGRLGAITEPYLLMSFSRSGLADRTGSSATSLSGRFMYCVTKVGHKQGPRMRLLGTAKMSVRYRLLFLRQNVPGQHTLWV